ncbi:MAG TPA: GAF domain-containing protein [Coleofasciculaceae cyanobacterium]
MTEVDVSENTKSKEQLIEELVSLHREVAELKTLKTAFDTLHELLITLVTTGKTATGALMLRAVLHQILKISNHLTDAEESSLFLLDTDGTVIESILARGALIRDLKQKLVGEVLDKGLAGWVVHHRKVGLVTDTMSDDRWLTLPNEPYTVRSAMAVPILRGKDLLSILTLMHSNPGHFSPESARLMQVTSEQMALVLESALLYVERQPPQPEPSKTLQQEDKELYKIEELPERGEKLSTLGIYMIVSQGKFIYTNPGVAAIFGYTVFDFIIIESIFELIAVNNREFVAEQINQCFQAHRKSLSCTFKGQRKDGSLIDVQIYGTKTKFSGKPVIIGILSST